MCPLCSSKKTETIQRFIEEKVACHLFFRGVRNKLSSSPEPCALWVFAPAMLMFLVLVRLMVFVVDVLSPKVSAHHVINTRGNSRYYWWRGLIIV